MFVSVLQSCIVTLNLKSTESHDIKLYSKVNFEKASLVKFIDHDIQSNIL